MLMNGFGGDDEDVGPPLRVDKRKLDITLTEIERGLKNEEAVAKAKEALLLVQAELKKSGNWTKTDYGWPKVREAVLAALKAINDSGR
jgi:hypothetical protein